MSLSRPVWVLIDSDADGAALIGAARAVADTVVALVIGERSLADQVATLGASEVRYLGQPQAPAAVEDYAPALAELVKQESPAAVLLAASTSGRLLGGRLAARLNTAVLPDASALSADGETLSATHPRYGGAAATTEELLAPSAIVALNLNAFGDVAVKDAAVATVLEVTVAVAAPLATVVDRAEQVAEGGDLASAKVVVGVGRGFGDDSKVGLAQALADALGGVLACTRPVAEGLGWLPRDRYLGVSGQQIAPDLYLAAGISGQPQHMVGSEHARLIVAVNKDAQAPIFQSCDYGIVGDLQEVLPALTDAGKA